jgi:hypothetical protein
VSNIYLFIVYLMLLSVIPDYTVSNVWVIVNNELESIWKEVAYFRYCPVIF